MRALFWVFYLAGLAVAAIAHGGTSRLVATSHAGSLQLSNSTFEEGLRAASRDWFVVRPSSNCAAAAATVALSDHPPRYIPSGAYVVYSELGRVSRALTDGTLNGAARLPRNWRLAPSLLAGPRAAGTVEFQAFIGDVVSDAVAHAWADGLARALRRHPEARAAVAAEADHLAVRVRARVRVASANFSEAGRAIAAAARWMSRQPALEWLQRRPEPVAHNKWARSVVLDAYPASGTAQSAVLRHGLTGDGDVVGVADGGVDWRSCMLADPDHPEGARERGGNALHARMHARAQGRPSATGAPRRSRTRETHRTARSRTPRARTCDSTHVRARSGGAVRVGQPGRRRGALGR